MEFPFDRKSLSTTLRWLWLVVLIVPFAGCPVRNGIDERNEALGFEESTATPVSSADNTDSHRRWLDAVEWSREPESLLILEFDQVPQEAWILELPTDASFVALVLRQGGLTRSGIQHVMRMPQLSRLAVHRSSWREAELLEAAELTQLENLNIDEAVFSSRAVERLAALPKLESLRLGHAGERLSLGRELAAAQSLQHLHLIGFRLTTEAQSTLDHLPKLRTLYLDSCEFDEAWLAAWQDAEAHRHVHVDDLHLDDSHLDPP